MKINSINLINSSKKYCSKKNEKYNKPVFTSSAIPSIFNEFIIPSNQNANTMNSKLNKVEVKPKFKINIKAVIIAAVALLTGIFLFAKLLKSGKIKTNSKQTNETIEFLKARYNSIIAEFPEDKAYYESLAKSIGLKSGEEYKLSSIVGSNRLEKLINNFTVQDFTVGKNLEGVKNNTYRVNLHNHTQASDGKLSVKAFLEQARKWADRVAANVQDNKPPFTIGITDHDTLEGCKEAVKIISENPEKFKNLSVVLGSEISVSYLNPKDVIRPVNFELIGYGLNPFDEKLNNLLDKLKNSRLRAVENLLNECKEKLGFKYDFNIEDTKFFHANLKNVRTNGVINLAGEYLEHKALFTEFINSINSKIIPANAPKLDANTVFRNLGDEFYMNMDAGKFANIERSKYISTFYKDALSKILKERNVLNDENISAFNKIFDLTLAKEDISKIKSAVETALPTIENKKGVIIEPSQVFEAMEQGSKTGFFGMAHPALIQLNGKFDKIANKYSHNSSPERLQHCKEKCYNSEENLVYRVFEYLKKNSKGLFKASEINYQSYNSNMGEHWKKYMQEIADKPEFQLLHTGGVDCHKPSIFKKHKLLTLQEIAENKLEDIIKETL